MLAPLRYQSQLEEHEEAPAVSRPSASPWGTMMRLSLLLVVIALSARTVGAQAPAAATPWTSLVGCWVQDGDGGAGTKASPVTCVLPVEGDPLAADVILLVGEEETRRSRIVADGTRREFATEMCRGSETARFSMDGGQVILQSVMSCGADEPKRGSGILGLTDSGRFVRVVGGDTRIASDVRFTVERRIPLVEIPRSLAEAFAAVPADSPGPVTDVALSAPALVEAARSLSVPVLEIWIAAHAADAPAPFVLPAEVMHELSDAGIPARILALLEALQNPDRYHLALSSSGAVVTPMRADETRRFRQLAAALSGSTSLTATGSAYDSQFLSNASNAPVGNACLGARVLMTAGFGTYGATPAFAHVLYARVCPTNGFYDPRTMNAVLYGAYGGPDGGEAGGRSRPRDSGQSGDKTPAADAARRRTPGTELEGGASYGRLSSHPAPEAIPLGGLGTPASSSSAPASSAPATPPVRPSTRERTP